MRTEETQREEEIDSNSPSPALKKSTTPLDLNKESEMRAPTFHAVLDNKPYDYQYNQPLTNYDNINLQRQISDLER